MTQKLLNLFKKTKKEKKNEFPSENEVKIPTRSNRPSPRPSFGKSDRIYNAHGSGRIVNKFFFSHTSFFFSLFLCQHSLVGAHDLFEQQMVRIPRPF